MSLHACGSHTEKTSHRLVSSGLLSHISNVTSGYQKALWVTHESVTGGTGPTSDTGWGCMLRCGQMILGEALVCRHLGRGKVDFISAWHQQPVSSELKRGLFLTDFITDLFVFRLEMGQRPETKRGVHQSSQRLHRQKRQLLFHPSNW